MRPALDEIKQKIEDLRLGVEQRRAVQQLATIRIKREVFKKISHGTTEPKFLKRLNTTALRSKIKDIVPVP